MRLFYAKKDEVEANEYMEYGPTGTSLSLRYLREGWYTEDHWGFQSGPFESEQEAIDDALED